MRSLAVVFGSLCVLAVGSQYLASENKISRAEPPPKLNTLAEQVANAYRGMDDLEFVCSSSGESSRRGPLSLLSDSSWQLRCVVKHGLNQRVNLTVYEDDELIYELKTELDGGNLVAEEHNHRVNESKESQVPLEDFLGGSWDFQLVWDGGVNGCRFGNLTSSWVGDSYQAEFFARIIGQGTYQGLQELDGRKCHVVSVTRNKEGKTRDLFQIDAETHLVTFWQSTHDGVTATWKFSYKTAT